MRVFYGAGLNENQHPNPAEAAIGSYNFDLKKDSSYLFPRMPFDSLGTATNGAAVRGLLQLIKRDNTETTLVQAGDTVYRWDGGTTYSSVTTLVTSVSQLRDTYWALNDYIVITDLAKHTPVSKWDGSAFTNLATASGVNVHAKYSAVHLGRVWLFNVKTTTDTPHLLVASKFEDPTSYDTTKRAVSGTFVSGSEAFFMLTPDLKPINGVAVFHGDLIISTERGRLYKLTGTNATNFTWVDFYANSNAVGAESMVNGGNDVYYMRRGGNIERVLATQQYGDVSADDLSRWISTTVAGLNGGIAVYDETNQKILWFLTNGKVLVFFKDIFFGGATIDATGAKAQLSPWSIYKTTHGSNFSTEAARFMKRPGQDTYTVFFGDSSGVVYDLNGTGNGDAGSTDITVNRDTRFLGEEVGVDYRRKTPKMKIEYERVEACDLNITVSWGDEYTDSTSTVMLKGPLVSDPSSYWGGSFYFGGLFYFGGAVVSAGVKSHINTDAVGRGYPAKMNVSSTGRVRYHIDWIELK